MALRLFINVTTCLINPFLLSLFDSPPPLLAIAALLLLLRSINSKALVKHSAAAVYSLFLNSALPSRSISSMRRWRDLSSSTLLLLLLLLLLVVVEAAVDLVEVDRFEELDLVGVMPADLSLPSPPPPPDDLLGRDRYRARPVMARQAAPMIRYVV